ncbi:hypothetical protein M0D76_20745, partial [Shewanella putrefaciens]
IVPPMKKALCQSIGIIGMWGLLTAYVIRYPIFIDPSIDNARRNGANEKTEPEPSIQYCSEHVHF